MKREIIYCTDNRGIDEPIIAVVREQILKANLPITSVSLSPIDFGENVVLEGRRRGSYTLILQIIKGLETSKADFVFFCEHDVLYHPTYFDFTPPKDDVFYYNSNVVKWRFHSELAITHGGLISFSELCCSRFLALEHYKKRKKIIDDKKWETENSKETWWSRRIGYEPGYKPISHDEKYEVYQSLYPNVDIRHRFCFSHRKTRLTDFNRPPTDTWKEFGVDEIKGWNIKSLFPNGTITPLT
jgi:hypothetical protein